MDIAIIGAGAAGLAALRELDRAGCEVCCLEARDRIGGRILTVRDPASPLPIELGAEFIHGRSPEIWSIINEAHLAAYDCEGNAVRIRHGIVRNERPWREIHCVMHDMRSAAKRGSDESFASFLARSDYPAAIKELSISYVEGFNAARQEIVGIASLAQDAEASEAIGGGRAFRFVQGYDSVPKQLLAGVRDRQSKLKLNAVVQEIAWRPGSARITFQRSGRAPETIEAAHVIVTIPLSLLQAPPDTSGAIRFDPEPVDIVSAARALRFGQVYRMILRFREAFWEQKEEFANAGFLLSDEPLFPTWWTALAVRAPILTGWSTGPHADALEGLSRQDLLTRAIESLAHITSQSEGSLRGLLEETYFHDWHADPFARGAYSYVPAGALAKRTDLARPVDETLYFAGEATNQNGHSATVHGAIASGIRAARQVLEAQRL